MTVRVACPASLTPRVTEILGSHPATSSMSVQVGVSVIPEGDVVRADLPREAVNDVVDALVALGVHEEGTIQLLPVTAWVSRRGLAAEQLAKGASADAVVWADVTERAYEDSAVTWTFMSFMVLATLLAAIAVVTDSVILIIGAMVLGPEFVPIAALGLGLVRRRFALVRQAIGTLAVGFAVAISAVTLLALLARAVGLVTLDQIGPDTRPGTGLHLLAQCVVTDHRDHCRRGGRSCPHLGQVGSARWSVHLGDNHPGRRQHRRGHRIRRVE